MKGVNLTRSGVPGRAAVSLAGEWLFRARGITKVYNPGTEAEVRALDGVDLDLFQGELAVLLGASGSGKSTLLNIIGGLDTPTGALDVTTGITVLEAVEKVNRELGTLVLLITHNSVISRMAGRVISLSAGRIQSITENESREPACSLSW